MSFGLVSLARESFSFIKAGRRFALAMVVGLELLAPARAQNFYRVTDLGDLPNGDDQSVARDINDHGQVVGESNAVSPNPFIWSGNDGMRGLQTIGSATAINNSGHVVGRREFYVDPSGAFLWTGGGGVQDLGGLPDDVYTVANDINDAGQVVGSIAPGQINGHAFLWTSADGVVDLGDLPGGLVLTVGSAINNAGQVVGTSEAATGGRAFLWTRAGGMQDLGDLPGGQDRSDAHDINNNGEVVGVSGATGGGLAFLWTSAGGMQNIGVLPNFNYSEANGINDAGEIVGFTQDARGRRRAFAWTSLGGMTNLNHRLDISGTGWTLTEAHAINNVGQIVGEGVNPLGSTHGFLLTPVPEPPVTAFTAFDEPALGSNMFTPDETDDELGFLTTTSVSGGASPLAAVTELGIPAGERVLTHRSINATTTFEAVDLTAYEKVCVSLRVQVGVTEYEASDFIRVYVTNNTETINLLNETGGGLDGLNDMAGDGFLLFRACIPDAWTQAALVITSSSNSSRAAEQYDFDSIEFRGVFVIPEPGTWGLVVAALVAIAVRRRLRFEKKALRTRRYAELGIEGRGGRMGSPILR